jgi:hypothetical protein
MSSFFISTNFFMYNCSSSGDRALRLTFDMLSGLFAPIAADKLMLVASEMKLNQDIFAGTSFVCFDK